MNFLKKIFSPFILTISLLLLFHTLFKSKIYWNNTNTDYYEIFYIISGLLVIFSIISFFINNKIKEYLIISLGSVIVTLYLFEIYITYYTQNLFIKERNRKEELYQKETGKKYDTRTIFKVFEDLKKTEKQITIQLNATQHLNKNYKLIPLAGISNIKTITCNENGYYAIYKSDRYGFNNPDDEWNNQEIEYLLVGDSFTIGDCVNRPNDIGSVLRTLQKKTVLNLGYSGNGPLKEYIALREYLNSNVKKVLWIYYEGNDLSNLEQELNDKTSKKYLNDLTFTQNLKLKQYEIDDLLNNIVKRSQQLSADGGGYIQKLLKFFKLYNSRFKVKNFKLKNQQIKPEFKTILKLAKELIINNNSELYFVYIPTASRYKTKYENSNYLSVKNILNELDIPLIDIHKELTEKGNNPLKFYAFGTGHFTVEGYKKVAETINKLTKN